MLWTHFHVKTLTSLFLMTQVYSIIGMNQNLTGLVMALTLFLEVPIIKKGVRNILANLFYLCYFS